MSGTLPTTPKFASATISSRNFNVSSETASGKRIVQKVGTQRWELELSYPPMSRSSFGPVSAFINSKEGGYETFSVIVNEVGYKSGDASGSIQTSEAGSEGDTVIGVDGVSGTLKAGDFFKFVNHSKVYQLTADRSGNGDISFYPPLQAAVINNEGITYDAVPFLVRNDTDVQEYSVGKGTLYEYELSLVEAK